MSEKIWEVEVTDQVLLFTQVDKPKDWDKSAIQQPYNDLNGTYLGRRGFEDTKFYLRRDAKMPDNSGMSWRQWRLSMGDSPSSDKYPYYCGYAWEPSYYYKYNGKLYATGAIFH